jgi:transcriptional regulator with XRE-family HTH domain
VNAADLLRRARRRARLSQRDLAALTGIAQPTIARIERGQASPRFDTVVRLLATCGYELDLVPRLDGSGVDRSAIRELLALTPEERLGLARTEADNLERLVGRRS